ncbi:MAG: hypothetical protein HDR34_06640 [Treponema sp.]|nr:hypothetical protein [Treponema sp.]
MGGDICENAIGCLCATLFNKQGYGVGLYAREKRLEAFRKNGLLYKTKVPPYIDFLDTQDVRFAITIQKLLCQLV